MYLHRYIDRQIYRWLGSIGGKTEFQFAFRSKITRNYIFEVTNCRRIIFDFLSAEGVSFATVFLVSSRNALSLKREMMSPNNGCEGDNSKRGTDAVHFYLELFRQ